MNCRIPLSSSFRDGPPFSGKGALKDALASRGNMTQSTAPLRIGTRGSPLALVQARTVRARLAAAMGVNEEAIELVIIRTSGDAIQDRPLAEVGGKGLFTKEIEEALLGGRIDLAVHSAEGHADVFPAGLDAGGLSASARTRATCSLAARRRHSPICRKARRSAPPRCGGRRSPSARGADLRVTPLRGNVETRLRKLDAGEVDATILALAGLKRLGLTQHATKIMSTEEFLPAVGQGAIGIEARADDTRTREALARIDHADTFAALAGRARVPCRARRLLQDADRRPCHAQRRRGAVSRADRAARRQRRARHRRDGPSRRRDQDLQRGRSRIEASRRPRILRLNHASRRHPTAG